MLKSSENFINVTIKSQKHIDYPYGAKYFVVIKATSIITLTPNDLYMCRTAQLTSRCCILYIYSTNIRTEYFKHAA